MKTKKMIRKRKSQRTKRRSKLLHQKTHLPRARLSFTKAKTTKMMIKIKTTKRISPKTKNMRWIILPRSPKRK